VRFSDRSRRRATVVISIVVHAVAGLIAVAYSFWHVEELTPPRVTVTFVSAAALPPPPPPPPPPLGGGAAATKRRPVVRPKVEVVKVEQTPRPTPVVEQPPVKIPVAEPPHEQPVADPHAQAGGDGDGSGKVAGGVKGGVAGGVKGGVVGGTVGGVVGAPAPKFLPPQMGAKLKISGPDPDFPAFLRQRAGLSYIVLAKICVTASGDVSGVTLLKRDEPTLDNNVVGAVLALYLDIINLFLYLLQILGGGRRRND